MLRISSATETAHKQPHRPSPRATPSTPTQLNNHHRAKMQRTTLGVPRRVTLARTFYSDERANRKLFQATTPRIPPMEQRVVIKPPVPQGESELNRLYRAMREDMYARIRRDVRNDIQSRMADRRAWRCELAKMAAILDQIEHRLQELEMKVNRNEMVESNEKGTLWI
jgi:hypothetical protein